MGSFSIRSFTIHSAFSSFSVRLCQWTSSLQKTADSFSSVDCVCDSSDRAGLDHSFGSFDHRVHTIPYHWSPNTGYRLLDKYFNLNTQQQRRYKSGHSQLHHIQTIKILIQTFSNQHHYIISSNYSCSLSFTFIIQQSLQNKACSKVAQKYTKSKHQKKEGNRG